MNNVDMTYDEQLEIIHETKSVVYNKTIKIYNLDNHVNKRDLAKISHIVEYYTTQNECLIAPKIIIDNLYLTDDDIIIEYIKLQRKLRNSEIISKKVSYLTTLFLLLYVLAITMNILNFNQTFNYLILLILLVLVLFSLVFLKSIFLKTHYKCFLKTLVKKYSKQTVIDNFNNIINNFQKNEYFEENQIINTKNHYASLIVLVKK